MKRGLVKLDPAETPPSVYLARLEALRSRLREEDSRVGLIYANVAEANGIDFLTNFCLYWNEAVLAVPVEGAPALIMKLSKRVQPWIKRTSVLDDIRSGPHLAQNVAAFIEERLGTGALRVAVNDMDWWPNSLIASLQLAMPSAVLHDLPAAINNLRLSPDKEELALTRETGKLLDAAIDAAWQGSGVAERTEIAVREARLAGFLDVDVVCRRLGDGTECIDAVGQFRYVWVRLCRARNGAMGRFVEAGLRDIVGRIRPGVTAEALAEGVRQRVEGRYSYTFSCLAQTDIETRGGSEQRAAPSGALREGEVVSPILTIYEGDDMACAAETVIVRQDEAQVLTVASWSTTAGSPG